MSDFPLQLSIINGKPGLAPRGAVQQAQHIYGYDKAGRITSWEQQSIGQPTAKTTYSYNLKDENEATNGRRMTPFEDCPNSASRY